MKMVPQVGVHHMSKNGSTKNKKQNKNNNPGMKITSVEIYQTKIYTFENNEDGGGYHVTKQDSHMDNLFPEYHVIDFDYNEVDDDEVIDMLKSKIDEWENR